MFDFSDGFLTKMIEEAENETTVLCRFKSDQGEFLGNSIYLPESCSVDQLASTCKQLLDQVRYSFNCIQFRFSCIKITKF